MNQEPKHIARIDILRAVAISFVVFAHFTPAFYGSVGNSWKGAWYHWDDNPSWWETLLRIYCSGSAGVALFFVVSGLCIRLSHLSGSSFTVGGFYWRRLWRIYPAYLLSLVIIITALAHYDWGHNYDWKYILVHVFLVQNFSHSYSANFTNLCWSLAPEMQIYLLYPLLLWLHSRWGAIRTAVFLAVLSVGCFVAGGETLVSRLHLPDSIKVVRQFPTVLWCTWYLGFLVMEQFFAGRKPGLSHHLALVFALAATPLCSMCRPLTPLVAPITGIMLSLLVFEFLSLPAIPGWGAKRLGQMLGLLGLCSYSIFLFNNHLIPLFLSWLRHIAWFAQTGILVYWISALIVYGVIFALSYGLYVLVERPGIQMGKKLYKKLFLSRSSKKQWAPGHNASPNRA